MEKLLAKYVKQPTVVNAHKVAAYWIKHPFSGMTLTNEQIGILQECLAIRGAR